MPILTLTTGHTAEIAAPGRVGLVCETAPDGRFRTRFPDTICFAELFGDLSETRRRAAALASRLVRDEPLIRGIQQLRVFEEVMIGEIEAVFLALNLRDWLRANRFEGCALLEDCWLASVIDVVAAEKDIIVQRPPAGKRRRRHALRERTSRVLARMAQSRFSPSALQQEFRQFLDHLDPYHRRASPHKRRREWRAGDIWFYTTAHTFTNIGLAYEPYFPTSFNFLVENLARGGAPLKAAGRPWTSLYDFSAADFAPSRGEIAEAQQVIERHLRDVRLSGAEERARDSFVVGKYFAEFCRRLLPLGLYQTSLFEEWADRVRPAALVVGNFVFEAYALLAARKHGVPTIPVQHGVFGADCGLVDPPVDHYVMRGKFWQGFLPATLRCRSAILNVFDTHEPGSGKARQSTSILYLTAPYAMQKFWSESDLDDILSTLLRCARGHGVELIIRVHPLENIGFYRRRIGSLNGTGGRALSVTYSQGGSLDDVLSRSAVAVTYSSTAFLDCLRWQVPIVSFDWHDFSYKQRIREHGVFYFAASLSALEELVARALSGGLPPYREGVEPFLASTSAEELKGEIAAMLDAKAAAGVPQSRQNLVLTAGTNAS